MVACLLSALVLVPTAQAKTPTKPSPQNALPLVKFQAITKNAKIKPGVYGLSTGTDDPNKSAIRIQGDGITVDFQGATLAGSPQTTEPDKRMGTAIIVSGKNVTIKNAKVRGYRFGLIARNAKGLKLINCDFSYNWKQHLMSTLEREDGSDWLSYHSNEKDEWMRYGTGIYLRKCDGIEIKGCTAVGGQNGLMMTECNDGKVWNSNFSFLSGAGLAMYRSSGNQIMHNKIDWCARGYSHGVYNRGQDSSGIIIYEQSNNNIFAYNSVTHGGDGFFLWAGQSTMDTGKGGCNGNVLYGNDFSHAIANGIEATFSSNVFANNLLVENWHGLWTGYSWQTKVIGNTFAYNGEAIAWEHGQDNTISSNRFFRDSAGINIWADPNVDPNWGYGKAKDVTSRDWKIENNEFVSENGTVFRIRDTKNAAISGNTIVRSGRIFDVAKNENIVFSDNRVSHRTGEEPGNGVSIQGGRWQTSGEDAGPPYERVVDGNGTEVGGLGRAEYLNLFDMGWNPFDLSRLPSRTSDALSKIAPKPIPGGMGAFIPKSVLRGRRYIIVDEWGPYDFKRPILWPRGEVKQSAQQAGREPAGARATAHRFEILGPKGYWKVSQVKGVQSLSKLGGAVPDTVDVELKAGQAADILIELEYTGNATTDYRGIVSPKGKPVKFSYRQFFAPISWDIKWFSYNKDTQEPRSQYAAFESLLESGIPILAEKSDKLDFSDGYKGVLKDHYATLANGTVELPTGKYVLNCTSDDGVKIWVDGKLVIERWNWHGPTLDTAEIYGGKHQIKVEHFEIDGYSALKVDIQPKK